VCLDDVQMSQFLEKLRRSAGLLLSLPLPPIPLYLVRAHMRLYVPHGLDSLLLYQVGQMVCKIFAIRTQPRALCTCSDHAL